MSKTLPHYPDGVTYPRPPEEVSIGILYPGNRVEKMSVPLMESRMEVDIEPTDAYERDIVIADNADRDLGKEVLKNTITDSQLVYRMRGDLFHELDLWGMHPIKEWAAHKVVDNVDGCIAVTDRLAERFADKTNIKSGSAGIWKRVDEWPTVSHTRSQLRALTLTNANYWQKVEPIVELAPIIDGILDAVGGFWHVCGAGDHTDRLKKALEPCENVHWMGYVDAKDYIGDCNILFHFSNLDGQPNSILEGMASNLPVVTNDFVEFRQFEGPIDVFHNQAQLRQMLRGFTDAGKRQQAGRANREYIKQQHAPEDIAREYERVCMEVLHGQSD